MEVIKSSTRYVVYTSRFVMIVQFLNIVTIYIIGSVVASFFI